mgnify:CR=1 FL=1
MLIFGLCLSSFLRDYQVTLFCREFQYWRIYAFFVLIFGVEKCACAVFHAFCMSAREMFHLNSTNELLAPFAQENVQDVISTLNRNRKL